jgi:signal transduction histidine kinase
MADRLGSVERTRRRLLADLGHEMRTPVATLEAYLEALEDGVATLDAGTAELLRSQTRRLARLSEDIGTVSRTEEGQVRLDLRAMRPGSVVSAAVDLVTEAYGTQGVRLVTDVASGPPELPVDPERMGQVLANLLDNARYAQDAQPEYPRPFERSCRVDAARDRAHGGSGIGLAIARALVQAYGGQLTATSPEPGPGSTFRVLLPRG